VLVVLSRSGRAVWPCVWLCALPVLRGTRSPSVTRGGVRLAPGKVRQVAG